MTWIKDLRLCFSYLKYIHPHNYIITTFHAQCLLVGGIDLLCAMSCWPAALSKIIEACNFLMLLKRAATYLLEISRVAVVVLITNK